MITLHLHTGIQIDGTLRRVLAVLFLGLALNARAADRVLVVNSDASVEKYRQAGEAFLETWQGPVVQIDLGDTTLPENRIRSRMKAESPTAIYCIGTRAYLAASSTFKTERIVLSSAINWERLPKSRNLDVIANELPVENQTTLFRYFFPGMKRIGVLCSKRFNSQWVKRAVSEAREAGVEIVFRHVDRPWQTEKQLRRLLPDVDALWIVADPVVLSSADDIEAIFRIAHESRKPVFAYSHALADFGATLVVAPDHATVGRQAAGLLAGDRPGTDKEPVVQHPAGSAVTLNIRLVEEYGLEMNERALDSVNHVIR